MRIDPIRFIEDLKKPLSDPALNEALRSVPAVIKALGTTEQLKQLVSLNTLKEALQEYADAGHDGAIRHLKVVNDAIASLSKKLGIAREKVTIDADLTAALGGGAAARGASAASVKEKKREEKESQKLLKAFLESFKRKGMTQKEVEAEMTTFFKAQPSFLTTTLLTALGGAAAAPAAVRPPPPPFLGGIKRPSSEG